MKKSLINLQGTSIKGITSSEIKSLKVNIPAIDEQIRIADFLSKLDERIDTQKKIIGELKLLKKELSIRIFLQRLRFKDKYGAEFPEWLDVKLEDICEIKKGEQFNKEELSEIGPFPCLNGGVSPSGFSEKYNTEENTITISEGGNSCGFVSFMTTKFWLGGHCYKILLLKKINLLYLYQLLKFNEREIMNLRVGSGLPNIQLKDLKKISIKISLSELEQRKISETLSKIDSKIETETKILEKLNEQKKYFLQNMFV